MGKIEGEGAGGFSLAPSRTLSEVSLGCIS